MTLEFLYADQRAERREYSNVDDALEAFDRFLWNDQLAEAEQLALCSPTISIEDDGNDRLLWASIVGDDEFQFYAGRLTQTIGTDAVLTQPEVRNAITLFFRQENKALQDLVAPKQLASTSPKTSKGCVGVLLFCAVGLGGVAAVLHIIL